MTTLEGDRFDSMNEALSIAYMMGNAESMRLWAQINMKTSLFIQMNC